MNTYNLALTSRQQVPVPGFNLAVPVRDPSWRPNIHTNASHNRNHHDPDPPNRLRWTGGWNGASIYNDWGPYFALQIPIMVSGHIKTYFLMNPSSR